MLPTVHRDLCAAALRLLPRESGGVLGGRRRGSELRVLEFVALENRADADVAGRRFAFDPLEFLAARARLLARGLEVLGFAHSHPFGAPRPSTQDRAELWRDCLQVITAPDAGGACALAAFWAAARGFTALPLVTR